MNSPQSQKEAVGSIVRRYVTAEAANAKTALILCHKVNFFLSIICKDTIKSDYLCKNCPMTDSDWKKRLGIVYSTNPDFNFEDESVPEIETLPANQQKLRLRMERSGRGGKTVTVVSNFIGTAADHVQGNVIFLGTAVGVVADGYGIGLRSLVIILRGCAAEIRAGNVVLVHETVADKLLIVGGQACRTL